MNQQDESSRPAGDTLSASGIDARETLHHIFSLLRERTGHDFRQYKQGTMLRRIDRRRRACDMHDLRSYQRLLDEEPEEAARLLQELLIGVTSFFRDRDDFSALEHILVPRLFQGKGPDDDVRAWVTACSTGEEAYSLGILLRERAAAMPAAPKLQLFATDADERAIHAARAGIYPATIADDVPPALLQRYFLADGERFRAHPSLRDTMLFAEHNLLRDPPFSRLDLITCRNFLIYLDRAAHRQVLEMFHFALKPGGYLFLGSAESADAAAPLFAPVDARHRLYQARDVARSFAAAPADWRGRGAPAVAAHQPAVAAPHMQSASHAELHRRGALRAAPPSILVGADGQILHIAEHAGRYLRHAGGEPTRDILALVAPALRLELRTALFQARQDGAPASTAALPHGGPGTPATLRISVQPLDGEPGGAGPARPGPLLVQFHETAGLPGAAASGEDGPREGQRVLLLELEEELRHTRLRLQDTMDRADAAGAGWKTANAWLQDTVAQLRATLEEQRRDQEELQSINEELMTVNAQLRLKVDETAKAHDDLSNLIASTDIATIFLDRDMRIQRYTPRVNAVFNVLPGDVGRPLAHLASRLDYPQLADDAAGVLASQQRMEREVQGRDGQCYIVRIHPYRTTLDRIEGAVVTFIDISRRRAAEQALRRSEERHRVELERQVRERTAELQASRDLLRATMDASIDMIQVFEAVRDPQGEIVDFRWVLNNHASERHYGEVRGQRLLERNPGVVAEGIFDVFRRVVDSGVPQQDEHRYRHEQFDGWFLQSVVRLGDGVATTTKDITEWKQAQHEVRDLRDRVVRGRLQES